MEPQPTGVYEISNQEPLIPQPPGKKYLTFIVAGITLLVLLGAIIWYFSRKTTTEETTSTISGFVFLDSNKNEKFDQGERGLSGFQVSLSLFNTVNGAQIPGGWYQATTDESGHYIISEILFGSNDSFLMKLNIDNTHEFVNKSVSFNVKIPPDATFNFPLSNRTDVQTVQGSVFEDKNKNGIKDTSEVGLANVLVGLSKNGSGESQSTKPDGSFIFPQEYSGYYTLFVKIPDGYSAVGSEDGIFLNKLINIKEESVMPSVALVPSTIKYTLPNSNKSYTLSGNVFEDVNGNGKQDYNENSIPGMTLVTSQLEPSQLIPTSLSTFMDTNSDGYFSSDFPQPQLAKKSLIGGYYKIGWVDNDNIYIPTTPNEIYFVLNGDKKINFGVKKANGSSVVNNSKKTTAPASLPIADSFNFSIDTPDVTAKDNDVIQFKGIITNNTKRDIYLNGFSSNASSQELVVDNSNFSTFPTKLKPGESYKGTMFSVYISQVALEGDYSGSFNFQGGPDQNSYDIIGSQYFSIHVVK